MSMASDFRQEVADGKVDRPAARYTDHFHDSRREAEEGTRHIWIYRTFGLN